MPSARRRPHSDELARRLRARARRVSVIRRRVVAISLTLLVLAWAAVFGLGSLGAHLPVTVAAVTRTQTRSAHHKSSTTKSTSTPTASAARVTSSTTTESTSTGSSSTASPSTSSSSSDATAVTPVTTSQS